MKKVDRMLEGLLAAYTFVITASVTLMLLITLSLSSTEIIIISIIISVLSTYFFCIYYIYYVEGEVKIAISLQKFIFLLIAIIIAVKKILQKEVRKMKRLFELIYSIQIFVIAIGMTCMLLYALSYSEVEIIIISIIISILFTASFCIYVEGESKIAISLLKLNIFLIAIIIAIKKILPLI